MQRGWKRWFSNVITFALPRAIVKLMIGEKIAASSREACTETPRDWSSRFAASLLEYRDQSSASRERFNGRQVVMGKFKLLYLCPSL